MASNALSNSTSVSAEVSPEKVGNTECAEGDSDLISIQGQVWRPPSQGGGASRAVSVRTEISPDILRGAHMSVILNGFGALWRTSPIDLPPPRRQGLWNLSDSCVELEGFISQTWRSSGQLRYLALIVRSYGPRTVIVNLALCCGLTLLDALSVLPTVELDINEMGWTGKVMWCPWAIIPPLASLAWFFFAPDCRGSRQDRYFFDAICINQVDDRLKAQGVNSLGGFVAKSRKLIILWCPEYFRRGWCVYEVAIFMAIRDGSQIDFQPLFVSAALVGIFAYFALLCVAVTALDYLAARTDKLAALKPMVRLLLGSVVPFFVHSARKFSHAQKTLVYQIERFTLDSVECREQNDLDFIKNSLIEIYGGAAQFEEYVRRHFKDKILASQGQFGFRYVHFLIMASPLNVSVLVKLVAIARTGPPLLCMLSALSGRASVAFFIVPGVLKMIFILCYYSAHQHPSRFLNTLKTLWISGVVFLVFAVMAGITLAAEGCSDMEGLLIHACGVILSTLLFHHGRFRCGCLCGAP